MDRQGMKKRNHTNAPKNPGTLLADPAISGAAEPGKAAFYTERPISKAYHAIDNDLARDNMENDLPEADLEDL